jgi:hypothetical protein
MNIAVSTVVIFLFLVPGILFRKFYYSDEFSAQYFKESFLGIVLSSFLPSLVIQYIWSAFVQNCLGQSIDLSVVFDLLASSPIKDETVQNIQKNGGRIFWYNTSMFVGASFGGWLSRFLIRSWKLDRRHALLRFKNHWHYILSGEFFDIPRSAFDLIEDEVVDIEVIYVDALVETKEGTVLYDGILVNHELTSGGDGLDYIVLRDVERRFLKDDSRSETLLQQDVRATEDSPYYSIPGHILILPYSSILNLNITYYRIEELSDQDGDGFSELTFVQVA